MDGVTLFISLLFFGFIAGCLVGLFGGGGGFYFVPVLSLVFQVQPQVAVATSLAAIIPTTISASISHFRQGNLDLGAGIVVRGRRPDRCLDRRLCIKPCACKPPSKGLWRIHAFDGSSNVSFGQKKDEGYPSTRQGAGADEWIENLAGAFPLGFFPASWPGFLDSAGLRRSSPGSMS